MKISLHNTLLRRKQEFVPIDENNVRMYVCGPTVYDRAHLGNAKTSVVFDVLYRFLCQVYGKDHVTYVSNITDVDDKILNKHKETGKSIREITEQTFQWYLDDMKKLNVLNPNHRPRATEYIQEMIELVKLLLQNGHALGHSAQGGSAFRPDKELYLCVRDGQQGRAVRIAVGGKLGGVVQRVGVVKHQLVRIGGCSGRGRAACKHQRGGGQSL